MRLRGWLGLAVMVAATGPVSAHDAAGSQVQAQIQAQVQGGGGFRGQALQGPMGSVTGTVFYGDTQRPARFAQVFLQPVPTGDDSPRRGGFGAGSAKTAADGTYVMPQVAPGDYYVMASATGYLSQRAVAQAVANAGGDANAVLAKVPVVHVAANSMSTANVTLERGGAVSGKLQWEDGSPAGGVQVQVVPAATQVALPATLQSLQGFGQQGYATTDDRGGFRVTGLATGDYYVLATVDTRSAMVGFGGFGRSGTLTKFYAPGVFRKTEAKAISVREGDERLDADIRLDLRALHAVSGRVTSSDPGQTVASGTVTLVDTTDSTLVVSAPVQADGSFVLNYVPAGNYTLQLPNASPTAVVGPVRGPGGRGGRPSGAATPVFQPLTMTLSVGETDVSGLALAVAPVATAAK